MSRLVSTLSAISLAAMLSGCAQINHLAFTNYATTLNPYNSAVHFKTDGVANLDYDIVGEGYGETSGKMILLGLVLWEPDIMQAYNDAVKSKDGDFLIEVRSQTTCEGFIAPIIYGNYTVKLRGLVAKIRRK